MTTRRRSETEGSDGVRARNVLVQRKKIGDREKLKREIEREEAVKD